MTMLGYVLTGACLGAIAGPLLWLIFAPPRPPRPRREYPPLNGRVPMPDGPDPLAAPWARCGCELVWRPCVVHDPAWPAEMERMVRGDSEPA